MMESGMMLVTRLQPRKQVSSSVHQRRRFLFAVDRRKFELDVEKLTSALFSIPLISGQALRGTLDYCDVEHCIIYKTQWLIRFFFCDSFASCSEKSNAEKRERSAQREAQKGKGEGGSAGPKAKKAKTADTPLSPLLTNPLNYVGATIASTAAALQDKKENEDSSKGEGLPPVCISNLQCGKGRKLPLHSIYN